MTSANFKALARYSHILSFQLSCIQPVKRKLGY